MMPLVAAVCYEEGSVLLEEKRNVGGTACRHHELA